MIGNAKPKPFFISPCPGAPWMLRFKIGYSKELTNFCWARPGCKWDKQHAIWHIPMEFAAEVIEFIKNAEGVEPEFIFGAKLLGKPLFPEDGYFADPTHAEQVSRRVPMWKAARPYQRKHAWAAAAMDRWIEGSEMGLGKAVIAMLSAQLRGHKTGIIVDTAGHRADWFNTRRRRKAKLDDEFARWWPGHPETETIETVFDARNSKAPIKIISYNLLPHLVRGIADRLGPQAEPPEGFRLPEPFVTPDFIWLDEAHMLQNPKVDWSIAARKLINEIAPKAHVLAMTGTLVPDNIMTIQNILDTIWPARFGGYFDFGKAYSEPHVNDFGKTEYWGTNVERVPELRERLEWMSLRTTKKEQAKYLPPFDVRPRWIDHGTAADREREGLLFAEEAFENGAHHVTLVAHHRAVADNLEESWMAGQRQEEEIAGRHIPVIKLTGELTPAQRSQEIRRAKELPRCLIVATLHAITTGVNLSFSPEVCFVEIYPRVVDMVQVLGRFHRMTSTEATNIKVLAVLGGDPLAELLMNKLRAVNAVMKPGVAESELDTALEELRTGGLTQDQVNEMLQGAAMNVSFDEFT